MTEKQVTYDELFKVVKTRLNEQQIADWERILIDHKDKKIPKVSVSKLQKDIQLSFVSDQKVSGTIAFHGEENQFLTINGVKISVADAQDIRVLFSKLEQAFPSSQIPEFSNHSYAEKNYGLLSADSVEKLSANEKKEYFRKLQALLEVMEKMNGLSTSSEKKTSQLLFEELIPSAWAQRKNAGPLERAAVKIKNPDSNTSCIYAGYLTTYGYKVIGKSYNPKTDKKDYHVACGGGESEFYENRRDEIKSQYKCKSSTQVACNPDVYGSDPHTCVEEKNINATRDCNRQATAYEAYPKTLKDRSGFDQFKSGLVAELNKLSQFCSSKKPGEYLPDQDQTCRELQIRIDEIKSLTCEKLVENRKDRFKELSCDLVPKPVLPPPAPGPGQNPPVVTPAPNPEVDCKGYALRSSEPGRLITNNCAQTGGTVNECAKSKDYILCVCQNGYQNGNSAQGFVFSCTKSVAAGPTEPGSKKKQKKEDWTPVWVALASIGIMAGYLNYIKKNKTETPKPADPKNGGVKFNNRGTAK